MRSVNKVILLGNVTRDPQVRSTQSGQMVCTFGIATNREWITSDGRQQGSAEYTEVVAWAKLADICKKYIRKGKLVYVEGYLKTRSWDTPEGIRRFKTEVVIQDMIMVGPREDRGDEGFEEAVREAQMDEPIYDDMDSPLPSEMDQEMSAPKEAASPAPSSSNLIDKDLGL
ncbi:MAG: hypothetical protein ACD_28C00063G0026 [uncultured bacterium]|nr:MAG: hypothetical protein ACD_28C00063G0026 [uncultured bacterium]KKT75116.1 MAG: Single-stranded DNA-binding protein [Candidatus Peregrinibacteria bacterium GW2011_GWA2_44_7]